MSQVECQPPLQHISSIPTAFTTNCLLAAIDPASGGEPIPTNRHLFFSASYELRPANTAEGGGEVATDSASRVPLHYGAIDSYGVANTEGADRALRSDDESSSSTPTQHTAFHALGHQCNVPREASGEPRRCDFPGVFDMTWVASSLFSTNASTSNTPQGVDGAANKTSGFLLTACTDGSVRVVHSDTLHTLHTFDSIHSEMLTSCTPLIEHDQDGAVRLLCTAHTGAVVLYDVASRTVVQEWAGHEFDAWCSAVLPMEAAAGVESMSSGGGDHAILLTGGDDGLLQLYDQRTRLAMGSMRFGAGVVSVAPVLAASASSVTPTPYVLVGSYDESLSLIDIRQRRRPVAQRTDLGGGVWRVNRCVFDPFSAVCHTERNTFTPCASPKEQWEWHWQRDLSSCSRSEAPEEAGRGSTRGGPGCPVRGWVSESNVLVLPLMQRGLALQPYNVLHSEEEVFATPRQAFAASGSCSAPIYRDLCSSGGARAEVDDDVECCCLAGKVASAECLIYDTAVVSVQPVTSTALSAVATAEDADDTAGAEVVLATCSFYEKRIDLWRTRVKAPS